MTDHLINGTSLKSTVGLVAELGNRHSGAEQQNVFIPRFGVPGGFFPTSSYGLRTETIAGVIKHTSTANRLTAEDELKRLLALEDFTYGYTRSDSTTRQLTRCRLRGSPTIQPLPDLSSTIARVSFTIESADPTWQADSNTTVTLSSTGTPFSTALGSADSHFVLTIVGAATNPTILFKNGAGVTQITLTFTITLGAGDTLTLDSHAGTIILDDSGVESNAAGNLTAGGTEWPLMLRRTWYDSSTPPTVQISAGAATSSIVYRKRYY